MRGKKGYFAKEAENDFLKGGQIGGGSRRGGGGAKRTGHPVGIIPGTMARRRTGRAVLWTRHGVEARVEVVGDEEKINQTRSRIDTKRYKKKLKKKR